MELIKNIFFNTDKLIENTSVKISYTGDLFQKGSDDVFIHYGFGQDWNNIEDIKMQKTELGFQAEINLLNSDTLNFCFKNNANNWDNNQGENYIFNIEPSIICSTSEVTDLIVLDNKMAKSNKLRKTYLWNKKIRLAIYKIITYVPKIISGNYSRKIIE